MTELLPPELPTNLPLESGIEFFEEQKRFTFILKYQCNKVFLNHVDSYNGRHILRYIGSREYVKPMEYDEVPGESGSLPTLIEAPSSPEETEEDGEGTTRENTANKPAGKEEAPPPFTCDLVGEGGGPEDSLATILGGLLNKEQMATLRSFPTRQQRADYLRNIFNEMNAVEMIAESAEGPMCYEISGTLKYCDECSPDIRMFLKERVRDLKGFLPTLLSCSTVIFDISRDPSQVEEARWSLRAILCSIQYLEKKSLLCFRKIKDVRKFILISSTMTWENTEKMKNRKKPVNEENLPLRKPHELFKEHKLLEQEVIRAGLKYPDIFKTYVLASGIPYGYEEDRFNYLFDLAWRNEEELPLLGDGHNALPIIHVEDLAMLVFYCMTRVDNSPTYLLAVEKNQPTLLQITESVSRGLTTGNTRTYALNERFPENVKLHEDTFAMLTSELIFEPNIHRLDLPWKYNMNMVSNMAAIIDEYIESRNLCPFKILVCGPPSSGKTKLARRLAEIYDLKYLNIEQVVKEYVEKLEANALEMARMMDLMKTEPELGPEKSEDDEDNPYPAPEEEQKPEELRGESEVSEKINLDNELDVIKHSMAVNGGIPEDTICIRILKKRLEEMDVLNHGYILDGWPETAPQAHGMFGKLELEELPSPEMSDEEEEAEVTDDNVDDEVFGEDYKVETPVQRNFNINPTYLILLDGDCDDLLFRHLAAKEDLERSQPSSVNLAQRMENYRELEKMCCRAFDFFDNMCLDVKVLRYQVGSDPCPFLGRTLKDILDTLGPPTNTGFLRRYLEEYKMIRKVQECEKAKKMKKRANDVEKMDVEYFRAACQFMDKWVDFKDNDIKEKSECIALNDDMLPEAIVEMVVKALMLLKETSPDDSMEFLAEFFLREYEKEKGRSTINTSCHNALAFRRCIDLILQNCEPSCLPLLPLAVDVIMKYRRFAALKGGKLPPDSCLYPKAEKEDVEIKSAGTKSDKRQDDFAQDFSELSASDKSVYEYSDGEPVKSSSDRISKMNLNELIEILIKTNPIWKGKIESDSIIEGKPLKLSDDSLKLLLDQLRQLSCEIRYRLRRRGIKEFDSETPPCSLKEWPTSGKECSGEIKPPYASEHSLDTKGNLEYKRKHEDSSIPEIIEPRYSGDTQDHDSKESDAKLKDSLDKATQDNEVPPEKVFHDKGVQVKIPSKDLVKSSSQIKQTSKQSIHDTKPSQDVHAKKDVDAKPEQIPDNMVRRSTIITGPDGKQFVCNYGLAQRNKKESKKKS